MSLWSTFVSNPRRLSLSYILSFSLAPSLSPLLSLLHSFILSLSPIFLPLSPSLLHSPPLLPSFSRALSPSLFLSPPPLSLCLSLPLFHRCMGQGAVLQQMNSIKSIWQRRESYSQCLWLTGCKGCAAEERWIVAKVKWPFSIHQHLNSYISARIHIFIGRSTYRVC